MPLVIFARLEFQPKVHWNFTRGFINMIMGDGALTVVDEEESGSHLASLGTQEGLAMVMAVLPGT